MAIGAYAAALGELDAFVFTAGIGERFAIVRAALCRKFVWLGVTDERANAAGGRRISAADSGVSVWVSPTDEDRMIAQHTWRLTNSDAAARPHG